MRILIADRNQLFNRLVSMKLEKWGHQVDIALTGDEAIAFLGVNNYRMVILDWGLEGISEDVFCQKVRQSNGARYTYILFYSERNDHDSIVSAYEAGADDYLFKPFNPQLLLLRIKTGKRMLNLEDELRTLSSYDAITGLISCHVQALLSDLSGRRHSPRAERNRPVFPRVELCLGPQGSRRRSGIETDGGGGAVFASVPQGQ